MTLLVVSIAPRTAVELVARADDAWIRGADAVEVRIDGFEDDPGTVAPLLRKQAARTWIVTCRSQREGGHSAATATERATTIAAATAGTNALVDFELANLRQDAAACGTILGLIGEDAKAGARLVVSAHDFEPSRAKDRAAPLTRLVEEVHAIGATAIGATAIGATAIAKVAYPAETIDESFAALDLMRQHAAHVIAIAMGEAGLWTRVLARKLGAFASFASLEADTATAPGQLTIGEMFERYRWRTIDENTRVYGVLGDPVGHSMSPLIFNRWFADQGVNAVYLPLLVDPRDQGLARFLDGCRQRPWLDIGGFSVTIPHKATVRDWLDERADWMSRWMGAVNTVQFDGDRVRGFNTDAHAAAASLADACGCSLRNLAGTHVDVLGTGGAARAVLHGLSLHGASLTVYGRSPERTRALADAYHATPVSWESRANRTGDILINTTSVGMWPEADASPMPPEALSGIRLVFDLIYNPLETRLLRDATAAGTAVLNGLDMFVRQAAMQFELWTGVAPDRASAAAIIEQHLNVRSTVAGLARPVALVGMRGSGKTSVGRALAKRFAVDFVDTDECVCQATGKEIAAIFAEEGEAGFRRCERLAIERVAATASGIISVGGGAVMDQHNAERLRGMARIVWLTGSADVLYERVSRDPNTGDSRPPLSDLDGLAEIESLLAERAATYERVSDMRVDTTDRTPEQVAEIIAAKLGTEGTIG